MSAERMPAVAGRFYPGTAEECRCAIDEMLEGVPVLEGVGAVVPHAGWIYSGRAAAHGIAGIAGRRPETVVIFGAVHVATLDEASLFSRGAWHTPLGEVHVDEELAALIARCPHVVESVRPHEHEHSIEVQVPFVQRLLPDAAILPMMVRPGSWAAEVGRACARAAAGLGRRVTFLGSTDLTHYGPMFGFEPHGHGEEGVRWAKEVNDRRLISLIQDMDAEGVILEAATNYNACGAGAVAAVIAAASEAGADSYVELMHTSSADPELAEGLPTSSSVGYEAGIFLTAS